MTGAWLLVLAALLLFGGQRALSSADIRAEEAVIDPVAWLHGGAVILQDEAVIVIPTTLTVSEPNGSDTFRLSLTSEPTATVSISLVATTGQCSVWPATVLLDSGNWSAGAEATVTAVDDAIVDGDMDCTIQTGTTTSADGNYDGLEVDDVRVTVEDDDEVGVTVDPTYLTVSEPSGSGNFVVRLTSQPEAQVSISLLASNNQCSVSPAELGLDAGNWNMGVTATVTAVDDDIADGDVDCLVQTGLSTSTDDNYDGLQVEDVRVTVHDDDQAGFVVDPTYLTVSEPSGSDTFVVMLTSQPEAQVTVPLTTSNNQCSVLPAQLVLNAGNWEAGATAAVTAVDDAIADGDMDCIIQTGTTISADDNYDGRNPEDVTVTVEDNDEVGILVDPTSRTISEPDGSDTFRIWLNSEPGYSVYVSLSATGGECRISQSHVWLTALNWSSGSVITVTANDDLVADGSKTCVVVVAPSISDDEDYWGIDPPDVIVTVQDDDVADVVVAPTSLAVSEPSGSATFNLRLTSQPQAQVSIPLIASNSQCSVLPATAILHTNNWGPGVTATVRAVDDAIADGDMECTIQTGPISSTDLDYRDLDPENVRVVVSDDDEASIIVAPTTLTVSEPSGSDTFVVRLASQPEAQVFVPLATSNDQCSVSPAELVLNAGNWNAGATATVTAVDDAIADGVLDCLVQTGLTTSTDDNYAGRNPADVTVTVQDDDQVGIVVSPPSLTISEPDGSGTFRVRLSSQPKHSVYVPLSTTGGECSISRAYLWLTSLNWSSGLVITVTAIDDSVVDGDRICLVEVGPLSSDDGNYNGLEVDAMTVTVQDDDQVGIFVAPTSLVVSEPSGSATFNLRLASQPTADVSVPLAASNNQCSVTPATAVLNAANWDRGATATVAAVNEAIADGDRICKIETGPTSSADGNHHGLDLADVFVTVEDDDRVGVLVAPTNLTVREPDGRGSAIISLTSEPTATVSIGLAPSNSECDAWPRTVTLGAANWQVGVTVSIVAQDDDLVDGSQVCVVQSSLTSSIASQYDGLEVDDITVTVHDNDRIWLSYLPLTIRGWPPLPGVPVLYPVANPDGVGTYTVAWSAAERAETYVLEEATVSTFAMARQVYSGPATSLFISGRGAARYYYRVKAMTEWAYGGWSNVQQVDVLWEAEPNNEALSEANGPLVSGLTYRGTFPGVDDIQDYYYFDLPAARSVVVDLTNIPTGRNYNLIVRNGNLDEVGYEGTPGNVDEHLEIPILAPGRYYIQVYRYSGPGSTQPYNLRVIYQ